MKLIILNKEESLRSLEYYIINKYKMIFSQKGLIDLVSLIKQTLQFY